MSDARWQTGVGEFLQQPGGWWKREGSLQIQSLRRGASRELAVGEVSSRGIPLPVEPGVHHLPQDVHPLVKLVDDGSVVLPSPVLGGHRRRGGRHAKVSVLERRPPCTCAGSL